MRVRLLLGQLCALLVLWCVSFQAYGADDALDWERTLGPRWWPRASHGSVVFANKMWVIGGEDGEAGIADVWCSGDGANWQRSASFSNRNFSPVVFQGKIWAIGKGLTYSNKVYSTSDGVTWELDHEAPFAGRTRYAAVVLGENMYMLGGFASGGYLNDVWMATPELEWTQVTEHAAWAGRCFHSCIVYDGKIWIIGGLGDGGYRNDVWWSQDGAEWTEATAAAPWPVRHSHTSVVFDDRMWVLGGMIPGRVDGACWWSVDGAEWTLAASRAAWGKRAYHSSVVYDGKMWVIGGWDEQAVRNTVYWSDDGVGWTLATDPHEWIERWGHAAAVFNDEIWISGGKKYYYLTNEIWHSQDGAIWDEASVPAWVKRVDHTMTNFRGALWVMGGTGGENYDYLNDVWRSGDGTNWTEVTPTAGWSGRTSHAAVVFNERLWVLGGKDKRNLYGDVWSSRNGSCWIKELDAAPWAPRMEHTAVVFDGKIWLAGGETWSSEYLQDLWVSSDGVTWTEIISEAPWEGLRSPTSVAGGGYFWILGGKKKQWPYPGSSLSWRAQDGLDAERLPSLGWVWAGRHDHASVYFDNRIWVLGGYVNDSIPAADIWSAVVSTEGAEGEGEGEGEFEGEESNECAHAGIHSSDYMGNGPDSRIELGELLRLMQFFNSGGFHCDATGEDGFKAGSGANKSCPPHSSDYAPDGPDWQTNLSELLRVIQFFNSDGYHPCAGSEDGFCPGLGQS